MKKLISLVMVLFFAVAAVAEKPASQETENSFSLEWFDGSGPMDQEVEAGKSISTIIFNYAGIESYSVIGLPSGLDYRIDENGHKIMIVGTVNKDVDPGNYVYTATVTNNQDDVISRTGTISVIEIPRASIKVVENETQKAVVGEAIKPVVFEFKNVSVSEGNSPFKDKGSLNGTFTYAVENNRLTVSGTVDKNMMDGYHTIKIIAEGENNKDTAVATVEVISWHGNGTSTDPYLIKTTDDLNKLAVQVNAGTDYAGKYFKVDNDITYDSTKTDTDENGNKHNYTAIGISDHQFKGKFNGNNKTISGIRIYKPNDVELGLFGALGEGAEVENVKLAYVEITGYGNIGGVAGYNKGTISNCTVEANVKIKSLDDNSSGIGGIVGYNDGGTVSGCTSSAELTSSGNYNSNYGGIVGLNYEGTVSGCTSSATLMSLGFNSGEFGGIVGYNDGGTVSSCTSSATLTSSGNGSHSFGGIVGYNDGGTVSGCTSSAELTSSGDNNVSYGGIVGDNHGGTISNNFAKNVTVSATQSYGAVFGLLGGNSTLSNNFYDACTVAGVKNAINVGVGGIGMEPPSDVPEDNGAVGVFAVTLGDGVSSITSPNPTYTDKDKKIYYKPGETLTLEVAFAGEKSVTFIMPNKDVEISFTPSELHTVSVPEGLVISNAYMTIDGVKYYKVGESYTLTASKVNYFIEKITNVTATIASDKKSATFTMPNEDVTINATIDKKWGEGDGRDGSEEHPYTIASTFELDLLASAVDSGNDYAGIYFEVIDNITYTYSNTTEENNYTAIGTENKLFKGKFNGNGKTISGIRIYKPKDYYQGLFGYLGYGAEVKNVKLADVEIIAHRYTGGIAGNNKGTVSDCSVGANVKIKSLNDYSFRFGGIVGNNDGGTVSGCFSSATLTSLGVYSGEFGGIVGKNDGGTVSGCFSSATLTSLGNGSYDYGGVVGHSYDGSISNNFAKNVMVSATRNYGALFGEGVGSISDNFYYACSVAGVENATNVGVGGYSSPSDVTNGNGAVSVFSVTLGEGISIETPASWTDLDKNKYYKSGETLTLTLTSTKVNEIIEEVSGVTVSVADDKHSATFKMPSKDVTISATTTELYTVSVPKGLVISNAYVTIDGANYYKAGESYTLTASKVNYFIEKITNVTATIASDKKSAIFTMPSEDVTISATIDKKWGEGDGRDGSEEHPYTIASTFELDLLASAVNSGNGFEGTYFEVVDNITYTYASEQENNYTAIGTKDKPFKGKFNGNGKTISGIRIYKPDGSYQGLFGNLGEGAEVENITLADVKITANSNTGGIAGYNEGSVGNCTVEESVKLASEIDDSYYFGGIVGNNNGGTVSGCICSASLESTGRHTGSYGGIVGRNSEGGTVSGCISSAKLTASGMYSDSFGGIVGSDSGSEISNSLAKNVTVSVQRSSARRYGAVVGGLNNTTKLLNNIYYDCTVIVWNSSVGVGAYSSSSHDVTENNGAVCVRVTEPTANENLVYNKSSKELVNKGSTNYGTLLYSLDGKSYNTTCPSATNAGIYTVYYKVEANSETLGASQTIEVTIAQAPVTISGVTAANKVYDGTTSATVAGTAAVSGVLGDDEVGVENGTAVFADANVGEGIAVAFSGFSLTGADKDNYYLSSQPSSVFANITKKLLVVTANNKTIAYGDEPSNDGVEYWGFVNGETESVLGGELKYSYTEPCDTCNIKTVIVPSGLTSDNYDILFQNGKLIVEPRVVLASGAVQVLEDQNGRYAEIDGNYGGSVDDPNKESVNITESIEVKSVSFNREFTTSGYSTVVFPFNVNTSHLSGVDSVLQFAYMVYDGKANLEGVGMRIAWSYDREDVDLLANTPYMVRMKDGEDKLIISGGVSLEPTADAVTESEHDDGWEFRGTYEFKQWSEGDGEVCRVYGYAAGSNDKVSPGDFVRFTAGARLRPLRAYMINTKMTCPTAQPAPKLARANGDNVVRASMKYADEKLPEYMNVVIIGDDEEHTTVIGRINTRTGEFTSVGSGKRFDIKGRSVRGKPSARGAYYKKDLKK